MDLTTVPHAPTGMPRSPTAKKMENMLEPTGVPLALIGAMLMLNARTLSQLKFSPKPNGTDGSSGETAKETLPPSEMEPRISSPLLPPPSPSLPSPCEIDFKFVN